jgi:hypothetical protein
MRASSDKRNTANLIIYWTPYTSGTLISINSPGPTQKQKQTDNQMATRALGAGRDRRAKMSMAHETEWRRNRKMAKMARDKMNARSNLAVDATSDRLWAIMQPAS